MGFPKTYDELKDSFSTAWADQIIHPWTTELATLEEVFWTELTMQGEHILWTTTLRLVYRRMQDILSTLQFHCTGMRWSPPLLDIVKKYIVYDTGIFRPAQYTDAKRKGIDKTPQGTVISNFIQFTMSLSFSI